MSHNPDDNQVSSAASAEPEAVADEHMLLFQRLDILIRALRNSGLAQLGRLFSELDVSPTEAVVLDRLKQRPNVTQTTLASLMAIDTALVSRLVSRLIRLGYVTSERDPKDRRVRVVKLTPQGDAFYERECLPRLYDFARMRLEAITPKRLAKAVQLLEEMAECVGLVVEEE